MTSSVGSGYARRLTDLGQIIGASMQKNIRYPTAFLKSPTGSHIICYRDPARLPVADKPYVEVDEPRAPAAVPLG